MFWHNELPSEFATAIPATGQEPLLDGLILRLTYSKQVCYNRARLESHLPIFGRLPSSSALKRCAGVSTNGYYDGRND